MMKHDPHTFLKLLEKSMDDYGIKAFTDLLPELNYTDICSGSYDVRNFPTKQCNFFWSVFGSVVSQLNPPFQKTSEGVRGSVKFQKAYFQQ